MSLLVKPSLWCPGIDPSHPLALSAGLVGCWAMQEGGGTKVQNLCLSSSSGTFVGMDDTNWVAGDTYYASIQADYINTPCPTELFSDEATLIMFLRLHTSAPAANNTGLCNLYAAGAAKTHYPYNDGKLYVSLLAASRKANGISQGSFDYTQWHQLAISHKPGANGWNMYQNRTLVHSATGDAAVSVINPFRIGSSDNSFCLNGYVRHVYLYNRALTAEQIAELHRDPWQFLRPETDLSILVGATSGGAAASPLLLRMQQEGLFVGGAA